MMERQVRQQIDTPCGPLTLTAANGYLSAVDWAALEQSGAADEHDPVLDEAARQLDAYFAGRLTRFDLPLAPAGTPFQKQVRDAMSAIPHGGHATYGDLARQLGTAPRAVGTACGRNPLPIIVPCHRVLARMGAIGGYSGGAGLATKRWLLQHEAAPFI